MVSEFDDCINASVSFAAESESYLTTIGMPFAAPFAKDEKNAGNHTLG